MSSVTRFLRQIPVSTTYYSLPDSSASLYVFDPDAANYVGNYPPGFMIQGVSLANVAGWLVNVGVYNGQGLANKTEFVLRDMGKTFRAAYTGSGPNEQYFRQVQILKPGAFPVPPPALSQVDGSSGVMGGSMVPSMDAKYATFYIPVTVAGLGASVAGVYPIAGGQM